MKHVFLDSSVLISFCASKTGASSLVLKLCKEEKLKGHISNLVITEVRKNTLLKLGEQALARFEYVLQEINFTVEPNPSPEKVEKCAQIIHPKDASILAAALINLKIKHLLTLDTKDFLKPQVITFAAPLEILTPGEFVKKYHFS